MTKQEFWEKLGYIFENYDIPCYKCPANTEPMCCKSCELALRSVYMRLEREKYEKSKN